MAFELSNLYSESDNSQGRVIISLPPQQDEGSFISSESNSSGDKTRSSVVGFIMEDFGGSGQNTFTTPFESANQQSISEKFNKFVTSLSLAKNTKAGKFLINALSGVIGDQGLPSQTVLTNPIQTAVMWVGSSRPSFTISLVFVATDPSIDVRKPIMLLLNGVSPRFGNIPVNAKVLSDKPINLGVLKAPLGYSVNLGSRSANNTVSLAIGEWFEAFNLLISSVNYTFSKETISSGLPLVGKVTVSFESFMIQEAKDVRRFFKGMN